VGRKKSLKKSAAVACWGKGNPVVLRGRKGEAAAARKFEGGNKSNWGGLRLAIEGGGVTSLVPQELKERERIITRSKSRGAVVANIQFTLKWGGATICGERESKPKKN